MPFAHPLSSERRAKAESTDKLSASSIPDPAKKHPTRKDILPYPQRRLTLPAKTFDPTLNAPYTLPAKSLDYTMNLPYC